MTSIPQYGTIWVTERVETHRERREMTVVARGNMMLTPRSTTTVHEDIVVVWQTDDPFRVQVQRQVDERLVTVSISIAENGDATIKTGSYLPRTS